MIPVSGLRTISVCANTAPRNSGSVHSFSTRLVYGLGLAAGLIPKLTSGGVRVHCGHMSDTAKPATMGRAATEWVHICERCGERMEERKCKIICNNCGTLRDCSDP